MISPTLLDRRRATKLPWRAAVGVVLLFVGADALTVRLGLPVPGSLVGMALLYGFCLARGGIPAELDRLARVALPWLPLYFVPVLALALFELPKLGDGLWAALLVITVGTMLAAAVAAFVLCRPGHDAAAGPEQPR